MPTRLTRYILIEILKIFATSLFALTALILLIGVARELVRRGLGPMSVVELLPYIMPISLQFAFPATALFSVCCVYGRMAAEGEVSTVKASGVSPVQLLHPAFIFAAVLSPISVITFDLAVSWGRPGINRVVLSSIEDIAYRVLASRRSYTSEYGFSIHVQDVVDRRLIRPTVTIHNGNPNGAIRLTAREGALSLDQATQTLRVTVLDSHTIVGDKFQTSDPGKTTIPISLARYFDRGSIDERKPSELPLRLISGESFREDRRSQAHLGEAAALAGFAIMLSRTEEIGGPPGRSVKQALEASRRRLTRLRVEPWRRWAWGFSCFFFVLVGAPLAMIARTSDYWSTFGICFVPTLLVYYPLFLLGQDHAKDGWIPPYGVWLGNVILGTIGAGLIARVRRY